ncbi:amino acid adenylation domain-containing protein [Actinokineospora sp. G85]|uniref:amino acid adenylation domain-containing protein n=1 Tax=Actinokineospora sp. G85 TaxID=3406626 RepID=UPI003C72D2B7
MEAIFRDARPAVVLTTDSIAAGLPDRVRQGLAVEGSEPRGHGPITCVPTGFAGGESGPPADRYALLQYTSGSTSTPKGVMVSDRNLLANSEIIRDAFDLSPSSVAVSWLPAYHDMGLIDGVLQPIHTGFPVYLMPPTAFLKEPIRWLRAISRHGATHSGGPNFAYTLCAQRTTVADRQELDLSGWLSAYNGAEPIRSDTLTTFAEAFALHGFRPRAAYPCYGLAEATLMVTGVDLGRGARVLSVAGDQLSTAGTAREAGQGEQVTELVGCGLARGDARVRVVDPVSRTECAPGAVGEIWVGGESVAAGYWNLPEETEKTFNARLACSGEGPFLRTGDLGFLDADELFVTGRLKDLIIIRGGNHYPQDLERTVDECDPAIRTGCAAAFAVPGPDSERLVIVCELTPEASASFDGAAIVQAIRRGVRERHGLGVSAVGLLPPGQVPKTSSGKIRRRESRSRYLDGALGELYLGVFTPRETTRPASAVRVRETLLAVPEQDRKTWLTTYVADALADPGDQSAEESSPETVLIDQGIDSLAAADLAHRMSTELGVPVSLTDFLERSTVEQVAQRLLDLVTAAEHPVTSPAARSGTGPERPLSAGERALWFLHTSAPASPAYNTCYAARLPENVDLAVLRGVLSSLSERHPALRTTFPSVEGRPRAFVHDTLPVPVTRDRVDRQTLDKRLDKRIVDFRDHPFDLANGPLVRALIVDCGAAQRVLVLAAHHIVVDLWSLRVLVEDLVRSYSEQPAPTTGGWGMRDHVEWAADSVTGAEGERQWRYWAEQLADAPTLLTLPYDRPRPAVQGTGGASVRMPLDDALLSELKAFAGKSGVTLYTLLLAAYQVLLHRCTGSTDFVVGTAAAARTRPESASLVGYLVNQLVLRARMADNPSFADHLGRVRETVLGALANQDFPFPVLVERLRPPRDPSYTPVFQVMFAYEKTPSVTGAELTLDTVALDATAARFDLILACVEERGGLTARWEYSTDLFDRDTIERFARHFRSLLTEITRCPEQPVGSLRLLTEAERRRAALEWNDTAADVEDVCLHQLIAAHVASTPDAVAVLSGEARLTYRELDHRAQLLAERLSGLEIGPGDLVAVCLRRSPDLVVALLAVLRLGAAFVPIDPTHPRRRIAHVLADTATRVVLTQRAVRDRVPGHDLVVNVDDPVVDTVIDPAVEAVVDPDALAYVLYTSGSTGNPKGVMVSHRAIVNYLTWARREYRIAEGAGAPVSSSVTFDATLTSLFGPLVAGRTVTLLSEENEINELRDLLLSETRQSLVKATPSQLELLRAVLPAQARPINVGALVVGGEAFPAESLRFWQDQTPGVRIYNEYGPTEATVGCCVHEATAHPPTPRGVPIGRPIANAEMYVLDANRAIAPIGVPGEIYIGGTGLARGYLNRRELTDQRFVPHPFRTEPDARVYRTGDRAQYLPDGVIEYLGRDDEQVKVRGIRVELGEIEAVLLEHPAVREVAVTSSGETSIDRRLTAHVVADPGRGTGFEARLRSFLAERLPRHMVPTTFILSDALPLNSNGKVDRAALRLVVPPRTDAVAPSAPGELEHVVAAIWREVLRADDVGADDNFFDVGGTSALAAEVQAKLSTALGREISLVALFRHPTIGSLARDLAVTPPEGPTDHDAAARDRAQRRARALRRGSRG